MIIKDIRLINFGKFQDKEIHFEKGMNIVYGENEAGKTTIHTFIRGMLFGIEKQRGKASAKDTYSKYEPWQNPENYRGMMRVESRGITYRFERNFNKLNKSFKVVNEDEGRELSQREIDELFQGLNESCYYNTISISQLGSVTDKELEGILKNYAANLGSTKSMEIDMKQALTELDSRRRKIVSDSKVGAKESVVREIKEITDELEYSKSDQKAIIDEIDQKRLIALNYADKKKELTAKDAVRLEKQTKQNARKESLYQEIMTLNQELDRYRKTLNDISVQCTDLENKLESKGVPTRADMERVSNALNNRTNIPIVCLILMMACFGCAGGMYFANIYADFLQGDQIIKIIVPLAGGVIFLIASIVRYFMKKRTKVRLMENLKESKILLDKLDAAYNEKVYAKHQYNAKEMALQNAKESLKGLEEEGESDLGYSEAISQVDEEYKTISGEISKKQWMLEQKQEKDIELRKQLDNLKERLEVIVNAETEIKALETAKADIEELANEVRNSFGKKLNERASYYMAQITNGKYDNLSIDENLNISVNGRFSLIPSSKLSKGTVEQIYMSLRLAAADIIFENDKKPILLDDAFAMFDNKRMGNTMRFMADKLEQVIIFSCHTREKVMADKLGIDYELKKL